MSNEASRSASSAQSLEHSPLIRLATFAELLSTVLAANIERHASFGNTYKRSKGVKAGRVRKQDAVPWARPDMQQLVKNLKLLNEKRLVSLADAAKYVGNMHSRYVCESTLHHQMRRVLG